MFENITVLIDTLSITFQSSPWLFYSTVLFIGLCVGSFLNVVAYRLPLMMERDWKHECHEYLDGDYCEDCDIYWDDTPE